MPGTTHLICKQVVLEVNISVGLAIWEQCLHKIHLLLVLTDVTLKEEGKHVIFISRISCMLNSHPPTLRVIFNDSNLKNHLTSNSRTALYYILLEST